MKIKVYKKHRAMRTNYRIHKINENGRIINTYGIGGNSWHTLENAYKIRNEWGGCIMEYGPHSTQPLWEVM